MANSNRSASEYSAAILVPIFLCYSDHRFDQRYKGLEGMASSLSAAGPGDYQTRVLCARSKRRAWAHCSDCSRTATSLDLGNRLPFPEALAPEGTLSRRPVGVKLSPWADAVVVRERRKQYG